jgi:phosphoadenosine phosphosulfate reductase
MDGSHKIAFDERLQELRAQADGRTGSDLIATALDIYGPRIAVVSSFGAESAVLLHLVADIDPSTPVIFLETGKHFPETLMYRDRLISRLGLKDVRSVRPDTGDLAADDPSGRLWSQNPDQCCHIRKVLPLERELEGFDAWFTGRKRFQTGTRAQLPTYEREGRHIKINPLADWTPDDVDRVFADQNLPRHPLVAEGYASIGCLPCTRRPGEGEDARAGRWSGQNKTECGIHKVWWLQADSDGI